MEFVLEVKNWDGREFSVALSRSPFSIGRGRENDLVLDEPSVSKQHARLALELEGLVLSDTGSLNGVYVNSEKERISGRRVLKPRDVIFEIGSVGVQDVRALQILLTQARRKGIARIRIWREGEGILFGTITF